jgi:hypothetical protein
MIYEHTGRFGFRFDAMARLKQPDEKVCFSSEKSFSNPCAEQARQRTQLAGGPFLRPRPLEVNSTYGVDKALSRLMKKSASLQRRLFVTLARNERVSGRNTLAGPFSDRAHWK